MRSRDSDELASRLGYNNERSSLFISAKEDVEMILEVISERDDISLRLRDYDVPKKRLDRCPSKRDVILNVMGVSDAPTIEVLLVR